MSYQTTRVLLCAAFITSQAMADINKEPDSAASQPLSKDYLETITVSATPINIDDAGSAVSIITRRDILNRSAPTVGSLLREIPGFAVSQQGSEGAISQLRVRGAEANQMLVLINGIEANDPAQGSEFDFSQLSTNDIERIEIVRGPQSALWGSDAMAGVIHIITTPQAHENGSATTFNASAEAGSFDTLRTTFNGQQASAKGQLKFSVDYQESAGTNIARTGNEDDGYENLTASLAGRLSAAQNLDLSYTLRYTDKSTDFDGSDFINTGLPVDANNQTDSVYLYGGIKLAHTINDRFDQALSFARTDTDNETRTEGSQNAITRATRDAVRYQLNFASNANRLSLLAEHETEDFEQRGAASFFGDPNQNQGTSTDSIAAEYRYDGDIVNASMSARQDNNEDFDSATSWRLTGNINLSEIILFASVGESVKNPTFTERFGFFTNFVGNPDLEPETSLQWEMGIKTNLLDNSVNLGLTYFDARLENEINGFVFNPASGGFTADNIDGESQRQGAELEIGYSPNDQFNLKFAYTYIDATQEDATGQDTIEVRRPQHIGSLSASYVRDRVGINTVISYTGSQQDDFFPPFPPFQERVTLDAYTLISINTWYDITSNVSVTGRLENVLDEDYEQVFGYASPGFGGYLGVRVNW